MSSMSRLQRLKMFVSQRLTAAVDDILRHLDTTMTEYEEELQRRHQAMLDERQHTDVQQLLLRKEEVQQCCPHVDQEDPKAPHIKKEEEELWSCQGGGQFQGPEASDIMFLSSPVSAKSEDDEEKPPASSWTEHVGTEVGVEDSGGPGPARTTDPDPYLLPVSDDKVSNSSEAETELSDDDKERGGAQPGRSVVTDNKCPTAKKSFMCCECGRKFGRKDSLRRHMRFHTGEKPYSCSICSKRFSQRPNLIRHMRCHSDVQQQQWLHHLNQEDWEPLHNKKEEEELRNSQETEITFSPVPMKTEHDNNNDDESSQSSHHQSEEDTEDCGAPGPASDLSETNVSDDDWTTTQSSFNSGSTDRESFHCSECGKMFSHKTNLRRHLKCHSGEKPFGCSLCEKSFTRREHLTVHMRCHSGEKPFSCSVCNTNFSHSWSLDKHMRVHTGEKPFCCSLCSKRFRQRSDLVAHFRIHTGEKPFSCSVCKCSFTQRHTMVQHMRIHTGVKPFSCSVCGKRFSRKGHMTRHMTAHTGEKPFSCSMCSKSFTWQSQFKRHRCSAEYDGGKTMS